MTLLEHIVADRKIEPCPFCGGRVNLHTLKARRLRGIGREVPVYLECEVCGASTRVDFELERVLHLWNTRSAAQAHELTAVEYLEAESAICEATADCNECPLDGHCARPDHKKNPRGAVEIVRKWREARKNEKHQDR